MLLDGSGLKPGDFAGLSAFQSCRGDIGLRRTDTGLELYAIHETPQRGEDRRMVRRTRELLCLPAEAAKVYLRIRYDFDEDRAWFAYSWDGSAWTELEDALQMRYTLDYFTGYRSALYCYATRELGGHADFDWFRQE